MVTITRHNIYGPMNTLSLRILITLVFIFPVTLMIACESEQTETAESPEELTGPSLLAFSKTERFRHDSIEHGIMPATPSDKSKGCRARRPKVTRISSLKGWSILVMYFFLTQAGLRL